jgi:2,5-diketo-D-gluconate reductase A
VTTVPTYELNDGRTIPAIGFGTYPLRGGEAVEAVLSAVDAGYRLIDTAVNYGNEAEVGRAVRECGVPREELFVTSKLPGRHHGYDDALASVEASLAATGLDYLDLHLIHWPNPSVGKYPEAWRALVEARERGLVRSIGVSNFTQAHLRRIIDDTGVTPVVNQIELHPYFPQHEMRQVNADLGIRTEAWSPLGKRNAPYDERVIATAAERLGVTPAQVILRWHIEIGSVPIPKSATPERQRENLTLFDFALTEEDVALVNDLARSDGRLFGGDPDTHEEM